MHRCILSIRQRQLKPYLSYWRQTKRQARSKIDSHGRKKARCTAWAGTGVECDLIPNHNAQAIECSGVLEKVVLPILVMFSDSGVMDLILRSIMMISINLTASVDIIDPDSTEKCVDSGASKRASVASLASLLST